MNTIRSDELFERALKKMPGGVNSPVRAFGSVGRNPLFISRGAGSKIYDEDGNEWIDYVCSWGPEILGHGCPEVIAAVREACGNGLTFGAPTKKEVVLAELIGELMPSMEMVRLVSSGTEAVMSGIRVARGFTKRDKIIKFKGCYHGHSDGLLVKAGSAALTTVVPDSAGVPASYIQHTLIGEYNNEDSVRQLFEQHKEQIACIIAEPVAANMGVVLPKPGFLQFLRDITRENGTLLIFDEVITGFRLSLGGAQEYYGIKPDLTTLGKIVGGGMPIGAYGGRKEIMEMVSPLGPVYQAGTLSGNPIATAAGIETLNILKKNPQIYTELEKKAQSLAKAYEALDGVRVNQVGSLLCAYFTDNPVTDYESAVSSDLEQYARYFNQMLEKGIYIAPSQFEAMFVSAAHSHQDITQTCQVIRSIAPGRSRDESNGA